MKKTILYLLIFTISVNLYSKNNIFKVEINPDTRATIHCSEYPQNLISELSQDKKNVVLKFYNSNLSQDKGKLNGEGTIKEVQMMNFKNFVQISIKLNDKKGYSTTTLPYTFSVMVDVFDWSKLSPKEDSYRMGLLALESKNYNLAKKYFENSTKDGNDMAYFNLGIINLRSGRYNDALSNLVKAEGLGLAIPDLYGGLSQIYSIKNNKQKSDYYKKLFSDRTGLKFIRFIDADNSISLDTIHEENSLISIYGDTLNSGQDSVKPTANTDSSKNNSLTKPDANFAKNQEFNKKFISNPQEAGGFSFVKIASYLLAVFIITMIIISVTYYLWRRQQIRKKKFIRSNRFNQEMKKADSENPAKNQDFKLRTQSGSLINKVVGDSVPNSESGVSKYNLTYPKVKKSSVPKDKNQVVLLAQEIINSKKNESLTSEKSVTNDTIDFSLFNRNPIEKVPVEKPTIEKSLFSEEDLIPQNSAKNNEAKIKEAIDKIAEVTSNFDLEKTVENENQRLKKNDGKYDLAIKLQKQNNEKKIDQLNNFDFKTINNDTKSIIESAKILGIEKAGVQTKKNILDITGDKSRLSKLQEKFLASVD